MPGYNKLLLIGVFFIAVAIVGLIYQPLLFLASCGVFAILICLVGLGRRIYVDYQKLKADIKRTEESLERVANLGYAVVELQQLGAKLNARINDLHKRVDSID